jgi:hypothetical protein
MTDKINEYVCIGNDGRFPEETPVLVRYPLRDNSTSDRNSWPWLPGTVLEQCGPDEWRVVVEVRSLAEPDLSVPNGAAPENLLYPACFRDETENTRRQCARMGAGAE